MPPVRAFSLSAVALTFITTRYAPHYSPAKSPIASFFTLFLLQLSAWILWCVIFYPKFFSPLRHLPQPPGNSFLMGQFFHALKRPHGESIREWLETVPNDGIIRYLDIFNSERLTVVSPKGLSEVLVQKSYEFVKPAQLRKGLGRILGMGIFLAEGEEHKIQRKNLSPAFAFRHIKNLYPIFWEKSQELVTALTDLTAADPGAVIDVNGWASRATLDIIGVAGLGHDFHALADPNTDLNVTYRRLFSPSRWGRAVGILSFLLPPWILRRLPIKRNDDMAAASVVIMRTCQSLIAEKKAMLEAHSFAAEKDAANPDILSVALSSGAFSDDDLANQLMTFLIAGHETTASALSWAIYELCRSPEIQARLRDEVRAHLEPHLTSSPPSKQPGAYSDNENGGRSTITADLINSMPYLSAFCAEILRLWPPVPITVRVADRHTSILGQPIPKGTVLMLAPWAMNRSTALWGSDALEFWPERWLASGEQQNGVSPVAAAVSADGGMHQRRQQANHAGGADTNFAQMTFLHGPRSCMGQGFAVGEFKCLVAAWVWGFADTRFAQEGYLMEVKNGITARPGGLEVKVQERKLWKKGEEGRG